MSPHTPAEFRCFALKALPDCDDLTRKALDELVEVAERALAGEDVEPTPCQCMMGRMFVEAIEKYIAVRMGIQHE